MVFSKEWLQNYPKFLLHFLIHIDALMLCSKFELISVLIHHYNLCLYHRTKKVLYPNVQRHTYFSSILGVKFDLRVTTQAMRCIDKAGGFDNYIYHTPSQKLKSKLGDYLKEEMKKEVKARGLTPPVQARRIQRSPERQLHQK